MSANGIAASLRTPDNRPPVTDDHRRAAFSQMNWLGWTFEQAMSDPVRSRVVESCARELRNREWRASHGLPARAEPPPRTQHNFTAGVYPRTPRIF